MTRRKAKGTTRVDKELAKAEAKIENLTQRLQAAQMQSLNLRQMYEGLMQEKQAIQNASARATQMLMGVVRQSAGNKFVLKAKTFEKLQGFIGVGATLDDKENMVLTLIEKNGDTEQKEEE